MSIASTDALIDTLRQYRLLLAGQLDELARDLKLRFSDPRALARELVRRGWLTPFQVNQIFLGRAQELVLGQYVLLERLGEGGMGLVFKARHQRLERIVALKLIRKERLKHAEAVARFHREAKAAARLLHPNIVTIFDADEVAGTHFFTMEFVDGIDLARLIKQRGSLPVQEACEYIRQAALGLQHAHEHGLVHRDIKPQNLMVSVVRSALSVAKEPQPLGNYGPRTTDHGQLTTIKILDMGLARLDREGDTAAAQLTAEGTVMGTPDYIAPEQAMESHSVDIRADIYSLGCTLYHLLTGQPPFPKGTLAQKLTSHMYSEPAAVESLRPEVPREAAQLVRKMMAKKPDERHPTPAEVASALDWLLRAIPSAVAPASGPVDPHAPTVAYVPAEQPPLATLAPPGAVAAASPGSETVAPGEAESMTTDKPNRERQRAGARARSLTVAVLRGVAAVRRHWRIATAAACMLLVGLLVLFFSLRPGDHSEQDDGVAGAESSKPRSLAWPLDNLTPVPSARIADFDWPPKGLVLVLGGHRGRHWGPVRAVAFSPDGQLVASAGDDRLIILWKADTLEMETVLQGHTEPVLCLAFTPNSKQILSGSADKTVRLWDVASGKEVLKLEGHTDPIICVAVSSDGLRAASGSGQLIFSGLASLDHSVRIWNLAAGGKADSNGSIFLWDSGKAMLLRRLEPHPNGVWSLAFSPDGSRLLSGGGDGTVRLWDIQDGKEVVPFVGHTQAVHSVALSKDGRYALTGGADKTVRLWDLASSPAGREVRQFEGQHGDASWGVAFFSDGRRALSVGDSTVRLWNVETGKESRRFETHAAVGGNAAVSGDGSRILGASYEKGYLWDTETGRQLRLLNMAGAVRHVGLSPDGRRALFGTEEGAGWLWDLDSETVLRRFPGRSVAFSPDARLILSGTSDGAVRLWDLQQDSSQPPTNFVGQTRKITSVAYAPNGKLVAASAIDGKVIVWDVATQKAVQEWQLPGAVPAVTFAEDSKHIATANGNGTAYILRLARPSPEQ